MGRICGMSRRGVMGLLGGAALGALHGPGARASAEAGPVLRRHVRGRTFDVHAHISAPDWYSLPPAPPSERGEGSSLLRQSDYFRKSVLARRAALEGMSEAERAALAEREARWDATRTLEDQARLLAEEAAAGGIDTFVNLAIQNWPVPAADGRRFGASFETVLEENRRVREALPGRMITFAGVDPRLGADAVALFETAVRDYGCAGYGELVSTVWRQRADDRAAVYPLMEKAIELDVPFLCDATMPFGYSAPEVFATILTDFPELRLCLGGTGSGVLPVEAADGSKKPAAIAMLELAERHENLWLDLDDWQSKGFEESGAIGTRKNARILVDFLVRAKDGPARDRILFGSDHPVFADLIDHARWIELIFAEAEAMEAPLTDEDWTGFFSSNAAAFLRVPAG